MASRFPFSFIAKWRTWSFSAAAISSSLLWKCNVVRAENEDLSNLVLISGSQSLTLADEIAYELNKTLVPVDIVRFPDSEILPTVKESVRGKDVYIIASTNKANESIVELLLIASSLRRASARTVTAVVPYFGYKRDLGQPFTSFSGEMNSAVEPTELSSSETAKLAGETTFFPIAASDIARMIETAGVDRVVSVDLNIPAAASAELDGFFRIPLENLRSMPILTSYTERLLRNDGNDITVVAPNESVLGLANEFRDELESVFDSQRDKNPQKSASLNRSEHAKNINLAVLLEAGKARGIDRYTNVNQLNNINSDSYHDDSQMEVLGNVKGNTVIIVDDMIDTGRMLVKRVQQLKEKGASRVIAVSPHGLFTRNALARIGDSCEVIVTNTVALKDDDFATSHMHKLIQVSVAPLLAKAIRTMHLHGSLEQFKRRPTTH
jgi:ribose-phosphate pyrophosphokinase